MSKFTKDPDAIARLSPEQYRVTQHSGTEERRIDSDPSSFASSIIAHVGRRDPLDPRFAFSYDRDLEEEGRPGGGVVQKQLRAHE